MNTSGSKWGKWQAPYDPRQIDGAIVAEDEHGRIVETADCGLRCPGCGVCCQGYRDVITADYRGEEEFDLNLKSVVQPGGMVSLGENWVYHAASCGSTCPGYERCCSPRDLQRHPESVAQAREIFGSGWIIASRNYG